MSIGHDAESSAAPSLLRYLEDYWRGILPIMKLKGKKWF